VHCGNLHKLRVEEAERHEGLFCLWLVDFILLQKARMRGTLFLGKDRLIIII